MTITYVVAVNDSPNYSTVTKTPSFFIKLLTTPGGLLVFTALYNIKTLKSEEREDIAKQYMETLEKGKYLEEKTRLKKVFIDINKQPVGKFSHRIKNMEKEIKYYKQKKNNKPSMPIMKYKASSCEPQKKSEAHITDMKTKTSYLNQHKKEKPEEEKDYFINIVDDYTLALTLAREDPKEGEGYILSQQAKYYNIASKNGMHKIETVQLGDQDVEHLFPECQCHKLNETFDSTKPFLDLFDTSCKTHTLQSGQKESELVVTMFHGTSSYLLEGYQQKGPVVSNTGVLGSAYYLTTSIEIAKCYAHLACDHQWNKQVKTEDHDPDDDNQKLAIIVYNIVCPGRINVASAKPGYREFSTMEILRNTENPQEFAFFKAALPYISCRQILLLRKKIPYGIY